MSARFKHLGVQVGCTAWVVLSLNSVALGVADLSDWVGINNMAGANNYDLTSSTSAGGTFAERRMEAASLSDHTVGGSPFHWNSVLSMSGTVTYSDVFDPVLFFGWYNSTTLTERIGMGIANPTPAGGGIRWQTQSGSVTASNVVSQNILGSGSGGSAEATFPAGTYDFTFQYDGNGHMTGTFDGIEFARNYALPNNALLNMDRFGILQKSGQDDDVNTFTFSLSNLNYTGDTQLAAGTPGDHNEDGNVDAADYVVWRKNDIDGQQGYDDWVANFGTTGSGSVSSTGLSGIATPEPSSFWLVALSGLWLLRQRTRS